MAKAVGGIDFNHSFNFNKKITTAHCSVSKLTGPSDEVGPSP